MNILNNFLSCVRLKFSATKSFFKNRKDKEKKLVTVSTDNSFKEFCHKGNQKNKAMASTILFDPQ